jgi:hypothetical protein
MKSIIKLALLAVITMSIPSCGNKSKEVAKVKPETINLSGDLATYLEIVNNTYEVTDDWSGKLSIKVKAVATMEKEELDGKELYLTASLLDGNGSPVSGSGEFTIDPSSRDRLVALLMRGEGEEVILFDSGLGGYQAEKHASKAKQFIVSSRISDAPIASKEGYSATEEATSSGTESDEDVESMLKSYDKYTDDYIKTMASMQKDEVGDALSNYADMMQSTQDVATKLEAVKDKMTSKQAIRMLKIQAKMAKAMEKYPAVTTQ